MVSLLSTPSLDSLHPSTSNSWASSPTSQYATPISPTKSLGSDYAFSSSDSLNSGDEGVRFYLAEGTPTLIITIENATVTVGPGAVTLQGTQRRQSQEYVHTLSDISRSDRRVYRDIRLLAISTHITELSYTLSDIQTRIFGASNKSKV
jgi:hypothetical protein